MALDHSTHEHMWRRLGLMELMGLLLSLAVTSVLKHYIHEKHWFKLQVAPNVPDFHLRALL